MTVIAWDGRTLAADRRTSYGSTIATSTKIRRMPDGALVGCAGNASQGAEMLQWFRNGRDVEKFPPSQRVEADRSDIVCIEPDGRIHIYQLTPYPTLIEDKFFSFGSGSNYALAALHLGFDAAKAVETACALDSTCGGGVDQLELLESPR